MKSVRGSQCLLIVLFAIVIWGAAQILNTPVVVVYRFGIYGAGFFVGYFVLSHDEVVDRLEKCWLLLAVCAVILAAAFTVLYWGRPYAEHSVLDTPLCSLFAWIAVIAVLALMKKWGNISNTLTRWMAAKSWGLYLFHYLFIAMTAYYLNMYTKLPAVLLYLFVAAAGNDGKDIDRTPVYPASYELDNVISAANISCGGELHESSNYGVESVDLAAPGSYILSTTPGNTYSYMTGTSMAAPMVSAAAAMLCSQFPEATLADVKDILLSSVQKLDSLTGLTATGGMLDLGAAMASGAAAQKGRTWTEPDLAAYTDSPPILSLSLFQWRGQQYLTVQVQDPDGDFRSAAYAAGTYTAANFQGGAAGTPLPLNAWGAATLLVRNGGPYTFYAVDLAGNETVRTVDLPQSP